MNPSAEHTPLFTLEAVRLGLASDDERSFVDGHLPVCPRCRALAGELAGWHREFSAEVLPLTRPRRRRLAWLALVLVPAAAALLLLARPRPPEPELGVKGGPALVIAARRGDRVFRPGPADPVRPGDQVRFVVQGARLPYVLVASVDGAGQASVYVPYRGASSAPLPARPRVELEETVVLDASPGPERVFVFLSPRPLASEPVRAALAAVGARGPQAIRAVARLEVGAAEQTSVLLEKETP